MLIEKIQIGCIPETWCVVDGSRQCQCNHNDEYFWREDEGYIRDTANFPVRQLVFGDTDSDGEDLYYTFGPLNCTVDGKIRQYPLCTVTYRETVVYSPFSSSEP